MTQAQLLEIAIEHHQGGRLADAETVYRQLLAANPSHADALHLLGFLLHQKGDGESAVGFFQRAIPLLPESAMIYNNFGTVLRGVDRAEEAAAAAAPSRSSPAMLSHTTISATHSVT